MLGQLCLVQRGKRQYIDSSLVHKAYLIWTVQEAQLFVCIFSVFVLYKYFSCLALISQNPSCILRHVFLKESVIKAVILRSGRYSSMSSVLFAESWEQLKTLSLGNVFRFSRVSNSILVLLKLTSSFSKVSDRFSMMYITEMSLIEVFLSVSSLILLHLVTRALMCSSVTVR